VSKHTGYAWKAKYSGRDVNEAPRLRQIEDENQRLKKLVADLGLDKEDVEGGHRKKRLGLVGLWEVNDFPRFKTPGRYQVKGRYISGASSPRGQSLPNEAAEVSSLPLTAWEGEIETNSVWTTIAERRH